MDYFEEFPASFKHINWPVIVLAVFQKICTQSDHMARANLLNSNSGICSCFSNESCVGMHLCVCVMMWCVEEKKNSSSVCLCELQRWAWHWFCAMALCVWTVEGWIHGGGRGGSLIKWIHHASDCRVKCSSRSLGFTQSASLLQQPWHTSLRHHISEAPLIIDVLEMWHQPERDLYNSMYKAQQLWANEQIKSHMLISSEIIEKNASIIFVHLAKV